MNGEDDHFVAIAQYEYKADSQEELSFSAGQEIKVAPKGMLPSSIYICIPSHTCTYMYFVPGI